jgi:hypothetical protein
MKAKVLLTSCAMAVALAVASQASAQVHNDHYACYQIKAKFPKNQTGTLTNQVEASGTFNKCKIKLLCVPSLKNGGGTITNANAHYCGWQCKGFKGKVTYTVTDQFAAGSVTTSKLKFILNACTKS